MKVGDAGFQIITDEFLKTITCGIDITDPIVLSDNEEFTEFDISLKSPPNCTLNATIVSPYPLSVCTAQFDNENWDDPQTIIMYNDPTLEFEAGTTCIPITVTTTCDNDVYHNLTATSCVEKITRQGSTANTWGDPHLTTFDGVKHDFFEVGDYYFVRQFNSEFIIQTRQGPCASVSCNYGVAIRYRKAVFYVFLTTDGIPSTFTSGDLIGEGLTINSGSSSYTAKTASGIIVKVKVGLWEVRNIYYLSIETTLPVVYQDEVAGLAGYYDDDPTNDFFHRGGYVSELVPFQQSWAVDQEENLFFSPIATIPRIYGAAAPSETAPTRAECTSSQVADNTGFFVNDENDTFPINNTDPFPDPGPTDPIPENITDIANETCTEYFKTGEVAVWCSECIPDGSYYEECMFDYTVTGGSDFLLDAINSYYSKCETECKKIDKDPPENSTCPEFCNMNGECVGGECQCNEGYSGESCDTNDDDPPEVVSAGPLSGSGNCEEEYVTVTGKKLTNITCTFGDETTKAVELTQWKVLCPVPSQPFTEGVVFFSVSRNGLTDGTTLNFTYYEACCSNPCQNGGTCQEDKNEGTSSCDCLPGYEGENCETEKPSCTSNLCENGGTCEDTAYGFNCQCADGFEGDTCSQASNCTTFFLDTYCYETTADESIFCFNLTVKSDTSCSIASFSIDSACGAPSQATPAGSPVTGGYQWDSAQISGNDRFCIEYSGYIPAKPTLATFTLENSNTRVHTIDGPYCPS